MKLESQVCTLLQAKRLKELGIEQVAIWFYVFPVREEMISSNTGLHYHTLAKEIINDNEIDEFDHGMLAAFTVAELGQMIQMIGVYSVVNTVLHGWAIHHVNGYKEYEFPQPGNMNNYDTEAEARADILIHLLENNLVTASDCNKRLANG